MSILFSSYTGLVHLLASCVALVAGMWVLATAKGTVRHRRIGYVYVVAMVVLNVTAMMIYRLFGGFGIFHVLALVSGATLAAGMVPLLLRRPSGVAWHLSMMYWSVVGVYAAFVAEVLVRLPRLMALATGEPMAMFYNLVGVGTALVMVAGGIGFGRYRQRWMDAFGRR